MLQGTNDILSWLCVSKTQTKSKVNSTLCSLSKDNLIKKQDLILSG